MPTVTINEEPDNRKRDAHRVVLAYLRTAATVLGAVAAVLATLNPLVALLVD
ncbi:hypothetical protein ACH4T9_22065 [Micromonospora sp. NPDC020750]|uniref:hypothetical protein n=1 Tax=unclassified Micromonospora TaxID=2617518 RepID=UPI00378D8956